MPPIRCRVTTRPYTLTRPLRVVHKLSSGVTTPRSSSVALEVAGATQFSAVGSGMVAVTSGAFHERPHSEVVHANRDWHSRRTWLDLGRRSGSPTTERSAALDRLRTPRANPLRAGLRARVVSVPIARRCLRREGRTNKPVRSQYVRSGRCDAQRCIVSTASAWALLIVLTSDRGSTHSPIEHLVRFVARNDA